MALNLLDSLSTTASAPEKNSFSLKNKDAPDGTVVDFSQLLGGMMGSAPSKDLIASDESAEATTDKDAASGQKVATDLTLLDGSTLMLTAPTPPHLTALVLSPNMTAITPSQSSPDAGSLVAFAKSQGLDEDVAAWLVAAGKTGTTAHADPQAQTGQIAEPATADAPELAGAAVAIRLLASPAQGAQPQPALPPAEQPTAPLMPMVTPAAWLSTRIGVTKKDIGAPPPTPSAKDGKSTLHTSDLDLSQIFAPAKEGPKSAQGADTALAPAAWVMAGVTSNASQTSLTASTLVKTLTDDKQFDDASVQVDALSGPGAERSPAKPGDPLASANNSAKASQPGLTTAERSELHQSQAEKMGQAIGQRMLSEMEKGHWHLKMMLKPANLGNIEVEMRLRNGELDANFTASQAATRDLLQDGLPKLKDTLTQMGMDVASMNIGGGSNPKNGGEPTPQQTQNFKASAAQEAGAPEEQPVIQSKQVNTSGRDGLDVMV